MATVEKSAIEQLRELEDQAEENLAQIKLDAARSGDHGYTLKLFQPIQAGAETLTELRFRAQTIEDVRGASDSQDAVMAQLCGITPAEIKRLSTCDYEAATAVLEGFHLRRAAGGPAQSTPSK